MCDIIKAEVLAAVQQFFHGDNRNFELLNEALIILLPKEDAVDIGDYWPISLLHSFAKIITKILAGLLAKKLGSLVGRNQSTFYFRKKYSGQLRLGPPDG